MHILFTSHVLIFFFCDHNHWFLDAVLTHFGKKLQLKACQAKRGLRTNCSNWSAKAPSWLLILKGIKKGRSQEGLTRREDKTSSQVLRTNPDVAEKEFGNKVLRTNPNNKTELKNKLKL